MKENEILHHNILVRFSKILLRFLKISDGGERGALVQIHEKQLFPVYSRIFWTFRKYNLEVWKSYSELSKLEKSLNLHHFVRIERCLDHKRPQFARLNCWNRIGILVLSFGNVNILFLLHFEMDTNLHFIIHLELVKTVGQG